MAYFPLDTSYKMHQVQLSQLYYGIPYAIMETFNISHDY